MTRKDYMLLADVMGKTIRTVHNKDASAIMLNLQNSLSDALKADNPSFNEAEFAINCMTACYGSKDNIPKDLLRDFELLQTIEKAQA